MAISALIMITLDYEENTLGSIYTDYPMMLYYVYLFLLTLKVKDNKYSFILLVLSLSMFLLTKQISIALYLVILFLFICLYFNKTKEFIIRLSSLIIIPLLIYKSWSLIIKDIEINRQFDLAKLNILSIFNGLEGIQKSTSSNYLLSLFGRSLTSGLVQTNKMISIFGQNIALGFLRLSYVIFFLIVLAILFKKYTNNKRTKSSIISSIIISFIGYALLMYIMYLFCFSENEMNRLASYTRYMGSFVSANLIIVLLLIEINYKQMIISTFIIGCAINPSRFIMKAPYFMLNTPSSSTYKDCANEIINNVQDDDRVLIIGIDGYGETIMKYSLYGMQIYFDSEIEDINDYDYIYFLNYNDLNGLYKVIGGNYEPISSK